MMAWYSRARSSLSSSTSRLRVMGLSAIAGLRESGCGVGSRLPYVANAAPRAANPAGPSPVRAGSRRIADDGRRANRYGTTSRSATEETMSAETDNGKPVAARRAAHRITPREWLLLLVLAAVQFTHIVDFMII